MKLKELCFLRYPIGYIVENDTIIEITVIDGLKNDIEKTVLVTKINLRTNTVKAAYLDSDFEVKTSKEIKELDIYKNNNTMYKAVM